MSQPNRETEDATHRPDADGSAAPAGAVEPPAAKNGVVVPAAATKPSLSRLFTNATVYGIGQFFSNLIGLVTGPILSYLLTRADFGLLGVTRSVNNMLTAFYRLGLDGAAGRLHIDAEHDHDLARRTAATLNTFVLVWAGSLTVVQELVGPPLYDRFLPGIPYRVFGRFISFALFCDALTAIPLAVWGAQEKARRIVGLKILSSLLSNALVFGLLLGTNLGVMSIFWAGVAGPLLMLQFYLRFSWGTYGFAWDTAVLKKALAFGLPMVVHLTSHWVLDAADRLMLDSYLGRESVGLYTVAYGAVGTLITINLSINGGFVPQFTRAHEKPEQRQFVADAVTYFLASAAAATLAFVSLSSTSIRLFYAAKFEEAAGLSPILCVGPFFHAVYLVYVNGLFFKKRTTLIPIATVLAGATNVGLNALLIPRIGIRGAAWATLAGYATLAFLFRIACNLVTTIPFDRGRLARVFVPLGVLTAAAWLVDGRLPLWIEVFVKLALVGAGLPALWLSGFLGPKERAYLRERVDTFLVKLRLKKKK